jgi:hypothetical protein
LCRIKVTHGTQVRGVGAGQVGRAASGGQGWERDASGGLGEATILLYLAVTYAMQRLVVQARCQRLAIPSQPGVTGTA